jgi:hypothetical protein
MIGNPTVQPLWVESYTPANANDRNCLVQDVFPDFRGRHSKAFGGLGDV